MRARRAAGVGLLLGAALVVATLVSTPWRPLAASGISGPVPVVSAAPLRDFSAAELSREDAFHAAVRPPAYAALLLGLLVALGLGLTPLGARLVGAVAAPLGGGWGWQVMLGAAAVSLVGRVVTLPFSARAEVVLRRYGLSTHTWASWSVDRLKGFVLTLTLVVLVLFAFYWLVRAAPRAWWLPAVVAGAGLVAAISFLFPLVVEPVFNRFTPMPAGGLRDSLVALAGRDGVPVSDVLVADASRRTTAVNAYVSGYGATRRIVVYDTLLAGATEDEVRLVVAHELGHASSGDVLRGTLLGGLGVAVGVCVLYLVLQSGALLRRAGVATLADARSLALVLALAAVLGAASGPVQLLVSRRIEAAADVHALDLTRDPETFVAMQRRLAVRNLSDLDPPLTVYVLFASHPTPPERIALARSWARAMGIGEPAPPPAR